ncbi:rhodanese-like domain-containing protein [Candidatus Venteria ishoeyi]|uniref:sulfurtransferase n=1 Tax=Candidatus Venteria ishoeyi TaxID=1899563 RepID=UPI0025A5787F|nr:rhodanese-like domain-containing protein [Candidatus Venteria ishoeyi]MDM8544917.1 rhodanese-like domain-containing protein [Candidatus Venteria ishoeyi]
MLVRKLLCVTVLSASSLNTWALDVPGSLVDTAWLADNLKQVSVLDVRKDLKSYDTAHIPGSVLINWKKVRVKRHQNGYDLIKIVPSKAEFEAQMQAAGINKDSTVVISFKGKASKDLTFATRLFWTFQYFDYNNVALLEGGTHKWAVEKRELSTEAPTVVKGNFSVSGKTNEDILATEQEVKSAVDTGSDSIIDGRTPPYFTGEKQKDYVYAKGHIPTAHNISHLNLYQTDTKTGVITHKSPEALKALFTDAGIDVSKPSIIYCNSGHYSTGHWFVLNQLLGNDKAASYDASMHEWTQAGKNNPVKMP